jgi:hypothetical protein
MHIFKYPVRLIAWGIGALKKFKRYRKGKIKGPGNLYFSIILAH